MIKTKSLDIQNVSPFWTNGKTSKPVMKQHEEITNDAFPNIVFCAKKKSGKTTAAIYLILKHFMTNKTKLIIFSGDIRTDRDNQGAFDPLEAKYPENVEIYKHFLDKDANNILVRKIDESDEAFNKENKSKYEYPRTIMYFDDLTADELRSPELDHLFKTNRHHGVLNILCCHNMTHISPTCREASNLLFVFRGMSQSQLDDIYKWCNPPMDKKTFYRVYKKATEEPRSFLFIDLDTKEMRKNLGDQIFIE